MIWSDKFWQQKSAPTCQVKKFNRQKATQPHKQPKTISATIPPPNKPSSRIDRKAHITKVTQTNAARSLNVAATNRAWRRQHSTLENRITPNQQRPLRTRPQPRRFSFCAVQAGWPPPLTTLLLCIYFVQIPSLRSQQL